MPLDTFQVEVLAALLSSRSPKSAFAGSSVPPRQAFRLSDDSDIFNSDDLDVDLVAKADIEVLTAAGFEVEHTSRRKQEGLVEVMVYKEGFAPTKLQWVQSGLYNFFSAVPDDVFGWRLHMIDIAVNKVLAAADRRVPRDFVDLSLVHSHVVPLWVAIWAAPGKDAGFSPLSLVDRLRRHNHFPQESMDSALDSLIPINAAEVLGVVSDALDEARLKIPQLPMKLAGNLFVDEQGNVATDVDEIINGLNDGSLRAIGPRADGAWPSGPDIDRVIIRRMIDVYGLDGSAIPSP